MAKKYATSPLALLRASANITQTEASVKLGMRHKQNLCAAETGVKMVSPGMMKKMVEVYRSTPRAVLSACTSTFESGSTLRKHRARQKKLVSGAART